MYIYTQPTTHTLIHSYENKYINIYIVVNTLTTCDPQSRDHYAFEPIHMRVHQGVAVWCSVLQLVADIFKMPSFHYITAKEPYTYLQRSSVYIQKNPIHIHKGALYTHQRALYISLKNPYIHPQRSPIHPQPIYIRKEPYIAAKEPYRAHLMWNAVSHELNTLAAHYTPPQKSLISLQTALHCCKRAPDRRKRALYRHPSA